MSSSSAKSCKEDRKLLSEDSYYAEIPLDDDDRVPSKTQPQQRSLSSDRSARRSVGGFLLVAATLLSAVVVIAAVGKHGCSMKKRHASSNADNNSQALTEEDYQLRGSVASAAMAATEKIKLEPIDTLHKMPCGRKGKPGTTIGSMDNGNKVLEIVNNARDAALNQLVQESKQQVAQEEETEEDETVSSASSAAVTAVELASASVELESASAVVDEEDDKVEEREETLEEVTFTTEEKMAETETAVDPIWNAPEDMDKDKVADEDEELYAPATKIKTYSNEEEEGVWDDDGTMEDEGDREKYTSMTDHADVPLFDDDDMEQEDRDEYSGELMVDGDESVLEDGMEDLKEHQEYPVAEERWEDEP